MRITFVLPHAGLAGGIRVLAIYANRLLARGHTVTVVSIPKSNPGLKVKLRTLIRTRRWPWGEIEPSQFDGTAVRPLILETNRAVTDNDVPDADVILATFWRTGPWVAAMSPKKGVKAIFLQGYETSPGRWNQEIDHAWRLPLHKIVVARWLKDLARTRFGDEDVTCIPNSVDTDIFYAPPRGKQTVPTVGFLYNPIHLKGVDVTVAALAAAKKTIPNLRALAFGAEHVSKDFPLPKWIEFHYRPTQSDIRNIYSSCDLWLCGSRQEGFHLPPLEAMACRCPVVSTRVGGPQDIVNTGVNGFLVEVDDCDGLAHHVLQIIAMDNCTWLRMSDAALETAKKYTWEDAVDLLEIALTGFTRATSLEAPCACS
jgi:glycosyltransferase involved in cell wall biosynthesis